MSLTGIETARLILPLVPLEGLEATVAHDAARLEALMGVRVPPVWFDQDWLAGMRIAQWRGNSAYAPWSIRAIIEKSTNTVIGSMNCHHQPMPFIYGDETRPAVELGYDIYEAHRRRGFAYEMVQGFFGWAGAQGVSRFILSISPENEASRALCTKLGGIKIGSQIDEKDGPEDIYLVER